ncbi:MAG: alkaline phosphatase, partial [Acidobacteria bacterium]|nr:alkaline phosphatase [Acidobacteriota bacterium]
MKTRMLLACLLVSLTASSLFAQSQIKVRIVPPNQAQFLQFQQFDVRVEATAAEGTAVGDVRVTLDGRDITSLGTTDSPAANVKNWTFRRMYLGIPGERVFGATAAVQGSSTVAGSSQSRINVRAWRNAQPTGLSLNDRLPEAAAAKVRSMDLGTDGETSYEHLHLGATAPAFHHPATGNAIDAVQPRAKNVVLFIGDGMGVASRTAARVLAKGYTMGKANGTLTMDRFPFNGLMMTSSMDSLITDSAPGAHNYSTGNKTNNGMEGVFPDNTAAEDDNPRIENLPEWTNRTLGMVTGIVSDAFLTDATPAAMVAHTQNRGNGTLIASQFIDSADKTGLKVMLGGGAYHFIPQSQTGSRRTDQRNVINDFKSAGFDFVETRTQLNGYAPAANKKLLGLFNIDNMNVAFDKLKLGDPSVVSAFPDQPFLKEMTKTAIDVLKTYPNGFFLMVEGAHVDKQAHNMDAERSIYDVIQLDQAVQVALDFAIATNTDSDPNNDTLVIVTADHECAGVVLPGVGNPTYKNSPRDYVKAYNYTAARNDPSTLNFTNYVDANGDGYPDNPDADRKLIVSFGANSDRYEDWAANGKPKVPSVRTNN